MLNFRRFVSVTSLFSLLAIGTAGVAAAATNDASAEANASHRAHRGHVDLLHASLRLDSLTASQRQQIEALVQGERSSHTNIRAARSQLLQAVAGEMASGAIDEAALKPSVQALEGAIEADEPADRAALETLHTILTPAQRTELVSRVEARHGHHAPPSDGGARPARMHGGMWGRDLNLTDAQKQQIGANLRSAGPGVDRALWTEARGTHEQVLTAFKGDTFVMNQVAPPRDPRLIDAEAERIVRVAKASAPILTPDQRAAAATKLRAMAARSPK
jgi:Spy/CpxP family protein refolding chaperone